MGDFRAVIAGASILLLLLPSPTLSTEHSPADEQVKAVWGYYPWPDDNIPPGNLHWFGGEYCLTNGEDLYTLSEECAEKTTGDGSTSFLRADIGIDSSGSVPASGEVRIIGGYVEDTRCTGFVEFQGKQAIFCVVMGGLPQPRITAEDQAVNVSQDTPVQINLAKGYLGAPPRSATLVGSVTGGTVTGFPSTTVTFIPSQGSNGAGTFEFTLASDYGMSNVATVTVLPTIFSQKTKAQAIAIASYADQVAQAFDIAGAVLDGPTQFLKYLMGQIGQKVGNDAVSLDHQIFGKEVDLSEGLADIASKVVEGQGNIRKPQVLAMAIDAAIFRAASLGALMVANDPPDKNYKTVAKPKKLSFKSSGNEVIDDVVDDYLAYFSVRVAVLHAGERWQGAFLAGDQPAEQLQRGAFNKYSTEASRIKSRLDDDNKLLLEQLKAVDINRFPGGAVAIADAYHSLCGKRVPAALNEELLGLGVAQKTINQMVCNEANSISASSLTTDFETTLSSPIP